MNAFAEMATSDIRLLILQLLEQDSGYSANESVIQGGLELKGHKVSIDRVRTEIKWLEEQQLLTTDSVADILVATVTRRGADVVHGRATTPGVKRPSPRG